MDEKAPRLRTVEKIIQPYPLNSFPSGFPLTLGKELIYLLATKGKPILEGSEFEAIFAKCIGAEWKPSNVGLDDVVLGNTAWGIKTVKSKNPAEVTSVRLISGRNSPIYSFGSTIDTKADPNEVGLSVLKIWNERVASVRQKFQNLRTAVLVKSFDLTEVAIFELDTILHYPELFYWSWNKNGNLIGCYKADDKHKFTWQPHGSQFTIVEDVPQKFMSIKIKEPKTLDKEDILKAMGFENNWISFTLKGV